MQIHMSISVQCNELRIHESGPVDVQVDQKQAYGLIANGYITNWLFKVLHSYIINIPVLH